ncbi:unnamed protein product [Ilex paraguariensis]|uniref:Transmembrane protein n=1 Tax=Ilex paraguariensis TaxID=185542 RepID=A0ABC8SGX6_9AQUA
MHEREIASWKPQEVEDDGVRQENNDEELAMAIGSQQRKEEIDKERDKKSDEDKEKSEEAKTMFLAQTDDVQKLQSTAFQLAHYHIVFQAAILSASTAQILTCQHLWIPLMLSIVASILNVAALGFIGHKYVGTLNEKERSRSRYYKLEEHNTTKKLREESSLTREVQNQKGKKSREESSSTCEEKIQIGGESKEESSSINRPAERKHWFFFVICMFFFIGFSIVIPLGCWKILCGQDQCKKIADEKCVQLCDTDKKCIKLCFLY